MNLWFTSDTHFGHANIIRYCDRPFADVREMDETLIRNWNQRVGPDDMVWHLGDVSFHNSTRTRAIIDRLNGHKFLVLGNHDHKQAKMEDLGFEFVRDETALSHTLLPRPTLLAHHPKFNSGWDIQLCGHVHEQWAVKRYTTTKQVIINVGVDVRGFAPMSIQEVAEVLTHK